MFGIITGWAILVSRISSNEGRAARHVALFRLVLALVLAWALVSCDLAARDPEDPLPGEGRLVSLTQPDSVLEQIRLGVRSGVINSYINAFAEDFAFHPDPQDSSPGVFDDWNRDVEREVAERIFTGGATRDVSFLNADSTGSDPEIQRDEDYFLEIDTLAYEGRARLLIRRDGTEWRVVNWQDIRLPGATRPTWGVLRGQNR